MGWGACCTRLSSPTPSNNHLRGTPVLGPAATGAALSAPRGAAWTRARKRAEQHGQQGHRTPRGPTGAPPSDPVQQQASATKGPELAALTHPEAKSPVLGGPGRGRRWWGGRVGPPGLGSAIRVALCGHRAADSVLLRSRWSHASTERLRQRHRWSEPPSQASLPPGRHGRGLIGLTAGQLHAKPTSGTGLGSESSPPRGGVCLHVQRPGKASRQSGNRGWPHRVLTSMGLHPAGPILSVPGRRRQGAAHTAGCLLPLRKTSQCQRSPR